jgi:3-hydroxyacyl-CoA dehydrogenase/enoyl-CoA hydratase/3-hydroxybutyryl-CoA epimerase
MSQAFHLQVAESGLASLTFDLPVKKVNVFTRDALAELEDTVRQLEAHADLRCLVLQSGKTGNFIAGADVEEIAGVTDPTEAEEGVRFGQELFQSWSELPFPTIAAVQGTCLGGGTELALASDYILISDRPDIRIGLPEVRLGIIPAWGGCSRLPGRIGVPAALDLILAGKAVNGRRAFKLGLADGLLPEASFRHHVRDFASAVAHGDRPARRRRDLKSALLAGNPLGRRIVFNQARKRVLQRTGGHYPAPLRAIEVVEVAVSKGLEAGLQAEARAAGELAVSPICKSLMHVFRLMEAAKKSDWPDSMTPPRSPRMAAVLGAGVMGGGIAQLIAHRAAIPVRLKDLGTEPLASGMAHAAGLFRNLVTKKRLTKPAAKEKMNLLLPTLDYTGFARTDIVIEAIVENLEVKQRVFAEVAAQVPPETILASNTSSLPIDLIGRDTPNQGRVVGMHFFNPVHKMPLVEVIQGQQTTPESVRAVVEFSRRLGKTPVIVQDGPGFLVNRLLTFYMAEALWLLDEGHSIEDIDRAMSDWGMPMGPMALIDEVGIDVAVKVAHILREAFSDRLELPGWVDSLTSSNRLGAKSGSGFYLYERRRRTRPDPQVYGLLGLAEPEDRAAQARLPDRMILPMVNEAARCLEDEIVRSAADLDLAMIMGVGFPPFRGGLCYWADAQDLNQLVAVMRDLGSETGERLQPCQALVQAADSGGLYATYSS